MKKYILIGSAALLTTVGVTATVLGDKKPTKKTAASGCSKMNAAQCKAANKKTCGSTERTHCFDMAMKTKAQ